ncbi:MAG: CDP-diacylglycerol--glycerol-3-phosphate 3-phosphatidyltransferase [Syntrophomonadaceae bacterium]|nr:CDP-diacylglycerol--glycerol-3-phosphate 3-phosphatidyltransferase [Syntrophomonadaceae bacterium]MDD3272389.1 CDP-diacylglycerol--glycerol-3-phosphate 3-phosphatidyltransferase [Syntrophomonadaceae bacterium]MDD3897363.1 CDP-diacylglycerol--glycerol-3-phosphate 3-phosphatidyltransferase [Syntrophomonadaceae bacterium]MDD4562148.1 CDP-diacylglycerol--glycerol-3-phosphate 3-phosphatidyltransferase [Syntrophomonadaceae bacterium]
MNLPNKLTILRIILIPVFVVLLLINIPYGDYFAAAIFIVAALTDSLDGYLARRWKQVTRLGILLDPLADKLLITAALISLVQLGRIPGWIAIVIVGREFAVSGLRAIKAGDGIVIPASILGKLKTLTQVIAVLLVILEKTYRSITTLPVGHWAMYIAVVITIISGVEYFYRFRKELE